MWDKIKKLPSFLLWIFSSKDKKELERRIEHEIDETIEEQK